MEAVWSRSGQEVFSTGSYDLTENFNSLKQDNNTVIEYTKLFEDLMAEVMEENPELGETWFVRCYVNDLREGIKFQLRQLRPQSLIDAFCLAKEIEPNYPPSTATTKKSSSSYVNFYQKNNSVYQNRNRNSTTPTQQSA